MVYYQARIHDHSPILHSTEKARVIVLFFAIYE